MIREALQFLAEQATEALRPQAMPVIPGEHETRVVLNGQVLEFRHPVPRINAVVHDIPSMLAVVERYADGAASATIWVRSEEVTLVLDGLGPDYRENLVRFIPGLNPIVSVLEAMASRKYTHAALLDLLRYELHAATFDESFALAIRNLKIRTEQEESREQTRTSDAMGKSVRAEVSGETKLPETVIFEFPAFPGLEEVDESLTVTCSVQAIPLEKQFKVSPLTGEMARIRRVAARSLAKVIQETVPEATVLLGDCERRV